MPTLEDRQRYDVVAVSLLDDTVLWVEENKTLLNAEAIIVMAVMRQGIKDRFFAHVPPGSYKKGERYAGYSDAHT